MQGVIKANALVCTIYDSFANGFTSRSLADGRIMEAVDVTLCAIWIISSGFQTIFAELIDFLDSFSSFLMEEFRYVSILFDIFFQLIYLVLCFVRF